MECLRFPLQVEYNYIYIYILYNQRHCCYGNKGVDSFSSHSVSNPAMAQDLSNTYAEQRTEQNRDAASLSRLQENELFRSSEEE